MWKTCYFIPSKCFGQVFKLFLPDFFVNLSSVSFDISFDYETANHLSAGAPVGNA